MITCRELVEQLMDFVNRELPPDLRQRFEEHLKQCPPCVAYVRTYEITVTICHKLPPADMPPEVSERLRRALNLTGEKAADT